MNVKVKVLEIVLGSAQWSERWQLKPKVMSSIPKRRPSV